MDLVKSESQLHSEISVKIIQSYVRIVNKLVWEKDV